MSQENGFLGKAIVAGCARDCEAFLPGVLNNIQRLEQWFSQVAVVVVENDSTDATKRLLARWGATRNNFLGVCLDGLKTQPARTVRLELARNAYLEVIRASDSLQAFDYLFVVDFDDANHSAWDESAIRRAVEFLDSDSDHAGVFANQLGRYFDMWALRHPELCPNDPWEEALDYALKHRVSDEQAFQATFARHLFSLALAQPPVQTISAFGGLGLYKLRYAIENPNPYLGSKVKVLNSGIGSGPLARLQICEHVHFNRGINALGGKLFILPWLINSNTEKMEFSVSALRSLLF